MIFKKTATFVLLLFAIVSCSEKQNTELKDVQIAFIADAHFQDIYAVFEEVNYKGVKIPETGDYANIRTMQAQLTSTRIFNENYFAFLAALDDIVARGIKLVALPGDFSDDGQPIHVKGLRKILDTYAANHDILFFATTGNHDPVKPFTQHAGKTNFLGEGGKEQMITSSVNNLKTTVKGDLKPIITSEIKQWGYKEILNEMAPFGFYPKKEYLYWETPFSTYSYKNYTFEIAKKESDLKQRVYPIDEYNQHPDASYLVEPISGLWLLAIDANVYMPKEKLFEKSNEPHAFSGASIGYNNVLLQKSHLIAWVKKVTNQAIERGKTLITFSHYPMVDFNDNASEEMVQFFGSDKMQLHRVPKENVAQTFADAGIQIHFGGHMHINDTGVKTSNKGNTLFNIQTPSLAAYTPAYKILSIRGDKEFEVETVVVDSVLNYNTLFSLYKLEYNHLKASKNGALWNKDILNSRSYKDFTTWHLKELVRLRLLPKNWPQDFTKDILKLSGKELLMVNALKPEEIKQRLEAEQLSLNNFELWTGFDMIHDFYRLRSADELALPDIGIKRLKQYHLVSQELMHSENEYFQLWGRIFKKTMEGQPSNHFKISLHTNTIKKLKHN